MCWLPVACYYVAVRGVRQKQWRKKKAEIASDLQTCSFEMISHVIKSHTNLSVRSHDFSLHLD